MGSPSAGNAASALHDAFDISTDLSELRPGQTHALIHAIHFGGDQNHEYPELPHSGALDLPPGAQLAAISDPGPGLAIWLPRTTKRSALTVARLLRRSRPAEWASPDAATNPDAARCGIGIVLVNLSNWDAAALHRTATIAAMLASFVGDCTIRFAEQLDTAGQIEGVVG